MKKVTFFLGLMLTMLATNVWAQKEVAINRSNWKICAYANPSWAIEGANDGRISAAIDESTTTIFHSDWGTGSGKGCPQSFLIDMGKEEELTKITFLPRQDQFVGTPITGRVYVYGEGKAPFTDYSGITADNKATELSVETLGEATLNLSWPEECTKDLRSASFGTPVKARYILLVADNTTYNNTDRWLCCADFNAYHMANTAAITYKYMLNGKEVASQTTDAELGGDFPKPTFQLPAGSTCSTAYYELTGAPTGKVTDDGVYDITINQKTPFLISESFDKAKWHTMTIQNTWYLNYEEGATSMDLNRKTTDYEDKDLFCFVGDIINGFKIYNKAAGEGYLLSSKLSTFDGNTGGKTFVTMVPKATAETQAHLWDITTGSYDNGFFLGQHNNNDGKNRVNNRGQKLAYWNGGAGAGSTILVEYYDITVFEQKVQNALDTNYDGGTDPGYYNLELVEAAKTTLSKALEDPKHTSKTLNAALAIYNNALSAAVIMPEVGKTYQFISGFPTFEATHGHKMAMFCDGTGLVWKQKDDTDKSFYWTVTKVDGNNITFQNAEYGTYPIIGYTTQNQKYPVSDTENYCLLTSLGQGQFNILPNGAGAALHAGNHGNGANNSGNVMIWDSGANSCSSWYIHDMTDLVEFVDICNAAVIEAKESQAVANDFLITATPTQYEWTTDTEQFSSNRPCSTEGSLSNLLDGDATTYFHSDWTGTFPSAPYHELYVNGLDDSVTKYDITYMRRSGASNDHVTQMEVYGGTVTVPENPDSEGAVFEITSGETPLAVIDLPYTSGVLSGEFFLDLGNTGYEALCFKVTKTNAWNADSRGYFHFGEFHMYDHNRLVPADVDVPAQFRALLEKKIAKLQALLDSPVLNAEYAEKIAAVKAEIDAALQDAKDNIKANRTFAETNKSQLDITAGKKGSKARASIEFPTDLVVAALGINDIDEAIHYAINGSAGYKLSTSAKYVTETGYRNAKGDVCAKSDAALQIQFNGGKFYVTPLVEFPATTPSMNIYTVYTANEIAFLFQVQVNFVAEEGDNATAINSVNTEVKAAGIIYDLTGRKVSSLKAGQIYIVNGQKVMIK